LSIFVFSNFASSTLAAPITAAATSLTLAAGTGALFPNPSAGQEFALVLTDAATGTKIEIVYCTARSVDTLTVVRAQEGTTGQAFIAGDLAANVLTAGQSQGFLQSTQLFPARIVTTASGVFAMSTADAFGGIGLNRPSGGLGASSTTLPSAAVLGQIYAIEDLARNFNVAPVTVNYPAGMSGPGGALSEVLNNNGQCAYFRFYGSNLWSFKP
jgi:hypothetical protein